MKRKIAIFAAACALVMTFSGAAFAAKEFVRIGTSSVGGGFFLIGNTIAQLGQQKMTDVNFTAVTGGSVKNMINLEKGELELGLTQSSTLALGTQGAGAFKKPLKKLRYITAIYPMPAHILVGKDAGIHSVADFKGKRIDFGSVGAGIEVNIREMLTAYNMTDKDVKIERFGRSEFEESFKTGRTQGTLWTTTTPNAQIADLIRTETAVLIGLEEDKLQDILKRYPHYVSTTIKAGTYENMSGDVMTFGAVGSLLTHSGVSENTIYNITKMLYENTDFLKERMGTYFGSMALEFALSGMGETALHPGAAKYYREKGIIK